MISRSGGLDLFPSRDLCFTNMANTKQKGPAANLPKYCVVGVWFQAEAHPSLLSVNNKVVVFDTPQMARDFVPRLGGGRRTLWASDDDVFWPELTTTGINRAVILWDYDPYEAPNGRSESRLHEWRNHIIWIHAFANTGQVDDSGNNIALGSTVGRTEKVLVKA